MTHAAGLRNPGMALDSCAVGKSSPQPMSARAERRAMIALAAAFALLVQALFPAMAMAAAHGPTGEQVICTDTGLQSLAIGGAPANPGPAHGCDHCVCPPVAVAPPQMTLATAFVAYAEAARPEAARPDLPPPARAPPRPPGQGPPTANA